MQLGADLGVAIGGDDTGGEEGVAAGVGGLVSVDSFSFILAEGDRLRRRCRTVLRELFFCFLFFLFL